MTKPLAVCLVLGLLLVFMDYGHADLMHKSGPPYQPNWDSLDSRPLPEWYDKAKFGIFMHWGVYSVAGFGSAWLWYEWKHNANIQKFVKDHYPPDWTYADWAQGFNAWWYDPNKWVDLFKKSGAKYVVLTSKHHEGFCNFPSPNSFNWNSKDVGPNRDLIGEYVSALRNGSDIHVGIYYSLFDFFNPVFLQDQANNFTTQNYVEMKSMPDLKYLINNYKPDMLWTDGDWMANASYWNSTEFLAWLYNESPVKDTVVPNDRWGKDARCKHGGVFDCNDRFVPSKLQKHKWENCMTVDKSFWAYQVDRDIGDFFTAKELITMLVKTVSYGGNLLMDVAPTPQGTIPPIFQERLIQMGEWLEVNGDAIYETHPCAMQNDSLTPHVWYTCKDNIYGDVDVYAILFDWPDEELLSLESVNPSGMTKISMLGYPGSLSWKGRSGGGVDISFPTIPINKVPSLWAWTLKIENLKSPGIGWTKKDYKAWQMDVKNTVLRFRPRQ